MGGNCILRLHATFTDIGDTRIRHVYEELKLQAEQHKLPGEVFLAKEQTAFRIKTKAMLVISHKQSVQHCGKHL